MGIRGRFLAAGVLVAGVVVGGTGVASAFDDTVPWYQRPVTVGSGFVVGNGPTVGRPVVSGSGQWVAFASAASNLVPNDTNGVVDLFLRDRFHDVTTRIVEKVDTAMAMSSNGRFIAFSAPGDQLTNGAGTTGDGIYDARSGKVIAAPGVMAINNDGWFASGGHLSAEDAANAATYVRVVSMSRLNDDGTINGPFAPHVPKQQGARTEPIIGLDASLSRGVYGVSIEGTPYRTDVSEILAPVVANMATGAEQSILDSNPPANSHPTFSYPSGVTISRNGRYVAFTQSRSFDSTKLWDTSTGQFYSRGAEGYRPVVSDDGRIVTDAGSSLRVSDLRTGTWVDIRPFDPAPTGATMEQYGFATDSNRVLTCTEMRFSRFDTNDVRDCYLVPLPALNP